jgi:hypothetical protein
MVYNVLDSPDKGKISRARGYSERQVQYWIRITRNFLMTKDVEKGTNIPASFEQDLGCWPLESVDQADCPSWCWGEQVKVARIPDIINIEGNRGLTFFGLIDKRTRIYVPESNLAILDDYQRFPSKVVRTGYMVGTNTIYIKGDVDKLKTVNVRGIFNDPTLTSYYNELGEKTCFDKNCTQYPISADLEKVLYQIIFDDYILKFAGAQRDLKNDEIPEAIA